MAPSLTCGLRLMRLRGTCSRTPTRRVSSIRRLLPARSRKARPQRSSRGREPVDAQSHFARCSPLVFDLAKVCWADERDARQEPRDAPHQLRQVLGAAVALSYELLFAPSPAPVGWNTNAALRSYCDITRTSPFG